MDYPRARESLKEGVNRVHPAKKKKGWRLVMFLLVLALMVLGEREYRSRIAVRNFASETTIVVVRLDRGIAHRDIDTVKRMWGVFCTINLPNNRRADTIQWKMAKLCTAAEETMAAEDSIRYTGGQIQDAYQDLHERVDEMHRLLQDALDYGSFKRL